MAALQTKNTKALLYAIIVCVLAWVCTFIFKKKEAKNLVVASNNSADNTWHAPDFKTVQSFSKTDKQLIVYGADLIANTAKYFGPNGTISSFTNGMNCQNCHLDAGTRPWGNNYSAVYSTYPKFRERSGKIESIYMRVKECFERSLGGMSPDSNSHEFRAIYSYMKWLGKDVPKGVKPKGSGIEKPALLNRAADSSNGKSTYITRCSSCHGNDGQGIKNETKTGYTYPPLWGSKSYTNAAGLYRLSNLAGYIKSNMPFNQASHFKPALSNEEAWDLAAYINSQPRPHKEQSQDWPDLTTKPFDFPFGPFADTFSQTQHKYGPFKPIIAWKDSINNARPKQHTAAL